MVLPVDPDLRPVLEGKCKAMVLRKRSQLSGSKLMGALVLSVGTFVLSDGYICTERWVLYQADVVFSS
eukprot:615263-Rhodomonas_salina.1